MYEDGDAWDDGEVTLTDDDREDLAALEEMGY